MVSFFFFNMNTDYHIVRGLRNNNTGKIIPQKASITRFQLNLQTYVSIREPVLQRRNKSTFLDLGYIFFIVPFHERNDVRSTRKESRGCEVRSRGIIRQQLHPLLSIFRVRTFVSFHKSMRQRCEGETEENAYAFGCTRRREAR